jgi:hypothetical protein
MWMSVGNGMHLKLRGPTTYTVEPHYNGPYYNGCRL